MVRCKYHPLGLHLLLLLILSFHYASAQPRVAIIGGGVGGTAAAHFLRKLQPAWSLELFERDRIGGRTDELMYGGKLLELGASIIHAQNQYVLSLAKAMNLTPVQGDDTGSAFSIFDGSSFVFKQGGSQLADTWAVLKRYGISPLRYKWLSEAMGKKFARIYKLQEDGHAYATPKELWEVLELYNVTQQSAANFMQDHLSHGLLCYGSGAFIEELAGAINRINYNQPNQVMNALAGLVSYLPAAQPEVYWIKEGNAALPNQLVNNSDLQAVHLGTAVHAVHRETDGRYTLLASSVSNDPQSSQDGVNRKNEPAVQQALAVLGPYDAVIIATPLEGSGIQLVNVLPAGTDQLPQRTYQTTVTSFVTGTLNPSYFKVAAVPSGDIFVTNSADTPFSVIASKGHVPACAALETSQHKAGSCSATSVPEAQPDKPKQAQQLASEQKQLWKVFSQQPLGDDLLQQLFIDGNIVASKAWKAYPRFDPPEDFAPFALAPGLCYNNALENGASAMEVSAVAAMNCALLVQQSLGGRRENTLSLDNVADY